MLDRFFADSAIRKLKRACSNPRSHTTLVRLTPQEFLRMAKPAPPGGAKDKIKPVRECLRLGKKFDELPYLKIINNGDGSALVVGHEGRHRCMALMERGIDFVTVEIICLEGGAGETICWGLTDAKAFPVVLRGQEGNVRNVMAFPDSIIFPRNKKA